MTTKYSVRVADSATDASGIHETSVRCTCGWSVTLTGTTAPRAVQAAGRARANHLEDAHPDQLVHAGVATSNGHELLIGGSTKVEHLWTRSAVCGCGDWAATVTERTPDRVAATVRSQHREHVMHETGRAPLRDYVVLIGLVAVIAVIMLALTSTVIHASAR